MRTSDILRKDMADYLPRYYDVREAEPDGTFFLSPLFPAVKVTAQSAVGNILDRESAEIGAFNTDVYDVLDQFFIDTASWGLANWERICGIVTDETKPIDQRRSVIRARFRGVGTVTVALIKSVAESFDNGSVSVTEDNAAYTITVTFDSVLGTPPNITDIQTALRDIIPAHLAITFVFKYNKWDELDSYSMTWDTFDGHAFTWDSFETYRP